MVKHATTLIIVFVGVFLLLMLAYAGLGAENNKDQTNTTEVQALHQEQDTQIIETSKPLLMGLGGMQLIILVVLILGGIGTFLALILGKRRH